MGPNSPSKFSAAKLFGFGGDSRKQEDPPHPLVEDLKFSSSFSTQAIKMESKQESFKPAGPSQSFDDEPILAGNNWNDINNDVTEDVVNDFNQTDDEEEDSRRKASSDVIGFHEDF